jgi:hypothetical protein
MVIESLAIIDRNEVISTQECTIPVGADCIRPAINYVREASLGQIARSNVVISCGRADTIHTDRFIYSTAAAAAATLLAAVFLASPPRVANSAKERS